MAKVWSYFFVMFWMLFILSSGIYLFSRGFLLSRHVRTQYNECINLKLCNQYENDDLNCFTKTKVDQMLSNLNSSSDYCLPQKTRIILVVIDALKYEFGLYDEHKMNPLPYENNLPVFHRLLKEQPEHSRFLKFVADAPTTTLQRLKGITTGSLPTFIDVGANFDTSEINEDNIIDQINRSNMSTVFLGDSTWTDLYPKRFLRQYSYRSFNIFDLDTVDNGINRNLMNEIKKEDWSLLVAHYLGVDHCGHKFGPLHLEMTRKLIEMNNAIETIIKQMDDDTTLFVIGDHGMTISGDHGGDTDDEVNTLLFAYNKNYHFMANDGNDTMDQIDLVPTISAILGTSTPYSNLGTINFNVIPDVEVPHLTKSQIQLLHTWQNTKQMHLYFHSYYTIESEAEIPSTLLERYLKQFQIFSLRVSSLYKKDAIESFCQEVKWFLKEIAVDCREIWAQFDHVLIEKGLIITAVTTIFLFLLTANLKFIEFEMIFTPMNLSIIYLTNFIVMIGTPFVHYLFNWDVSIVDVLLYVCIYSLILLVWLLVKNWIFIATNWSTQQHFGNFFTRSIFLMVVSSFFSNSFIIYEQNVLCYVICGALIVFLYKIRKEYTWIARLRKLRPELLFNLPFFKLATFTMLAILLLRSSYWLHRCREEHGNCNEFEQPSTIKSRSKMDSMHWNDLLPILSVALFAAVSRLFLKKCGNLSGFSSHVVLARYGPIVAAVACSLHFCATITNTTKSMKGINQIRIDALAWIVYIVFVLQVIIVACRPLMLFILKKPDRTFNVSPFGRVVPQIVMKMKQMYDDSANSASGTDDIPVVYGLATVYSSVLISLSVGLALVLALLLGPIPANGIFIVLAAACLVVVLNAIHRYQQCNRLAFCLQPEVIALFLWHLLGHYSFYATSHQPTLSQIDWHAAFVGRTAMYDHNNIISAVLIILNTFGGHLLIYILYPLLIIAPNALYTIYPSLAPRRTAKLVIQNQNGTEQREIVKKIRDQREHSTVNVTTIGGLDSENQNINFSHGELTLYENEDIFFGQLYKTGAQLILLQAIRIFCSMIASTIHCRHLMVWKIFAPRFIFEAIASYVIFGGILIGFLIIIRIHKAVNSLITEMSDVNSFK